MEEFNSSCIYCEQSILWLARLKGNWDQVFWLFIIKIKKEMENPRGTIDTTVAMG